MRSLIRVLLVLASPLVHSVATAQPPAKNPASHSYEQRRLAREAILARMVRDHGYGLAVGQAVKHIPQPVPPISREFYRAESSDSGGVQTGPDATFFRYNDGKLVRWGNTFRGGKEKGYTLGQLLDAFFGFKGRMVEGSPSLLERDLPGDWIILDSALQLPGEAPAQLEKILADDFGFRVKLEIREVERPVVVVRGTYRYSPTRLDVEKENADPDNVDVLRIYEDEASLETRANGSGSGDFGVVLTWLGEAIDKIVIDERSAQTEGADLSWRRHPAARDLNARDRSKSDAAAILRNMESQTGLTFTQELRPVNVMFVTPAKP